MKAYLELEMPESCSNCTIGRYTDEDDYNRIYCPAISTWFNDRKFQDKRRADCPLKPLTGDSCIAELRMKTSG